MFALELLHRSRSSMVFCVCLFCLCLSFFGSIWFGRSRSVRIEFPSDCAIGHVLILLLHWINLMEISFEYITQGFLCVCLFVFVCLFLVPSVRPYIWSIKIVPSVTFNVLPPICVFVCLSVTFFSPDLRTDGQTTWLYATELKLNWNNWNLSPSVTFVHTDILLIFPFWREVKWLHPAIRPSVHSDFHFSERSWVQKPEWFCHFAFILKNDFRSGRTDFSMTQASWRFTSRIVPSVETNIYITLTVKYLL
jgi:hypothetical protein